MTPTPQDNNKIQKGRVRGMELLNKTIGDCLNVRAEESPDKVAIEYWDQSYTWEEVDRFSDYLAGRMLASGMKKGDHAGIWSVNTPNWILTFFAMTKIGVVPILINTCYKEMELSHLIQYADVRYMYYGESYKKLCYESMTETIRRMEGCPVEKWIPIGRDHTGKWMTESSFTDEEKSYARAEFLRTQKNLVKPEDTAAMLFTSGTTSVSKGVMLSHYNLVNSAQGTLDFTRWTADDKVLLAVPLFHCFGITSCLLTSVLDGCTIHLLKYAKTIKLLESIDQYHCTVLNGVPSMFLAMIRKPEFYDYDTTSLRSGIIAGSAVSAKEYMEIQKYLPNMNLLPSYGQTETSPCVTLMTDEDPYDKRAATAGRLIAYEELRVSDPQSGEVLSEGATGEIEVRGYNIMQGYYKMEEETAAAISADGWLKTGDLGFMDPEGYLHIIGRKKEMIIRCGENIAPLEIENVISELDCVNAVKVIGIPAEVVQEMIVACVVPKPGRIISESIIISYLTSRLAHYKIPSYVLEFSSLPMNASGKILLPELKEQVIARLKKEKEGM